MDSKILIRFELPSAVNEGRPPADPAKLLRYEFRLVFSGRVAIWVGGEENIILDDSPLIGTLLDLQDGLLRLQSSTSPTIASDDYGEYSMTFRRARRLIEFETNYGGGKRSIFRASADDFRTAVAKFGNDLLSSIEEKFPGILENPHYPWLRDLILCWEDRFSGI